MSGQMRPHNKQSLKKNERHPTENMTRFCKNNDIDFLSVFKNGTYIHPSQRLVVIDENLIHELTVNQFLGTKPLKLSFKF